MVTETAAPAPPPRLGECHDSSFWVLFVVVWGGRGHLHEPPITLATALRHSDASSPQSLGIGSIAIITNSFSPLHFIGTNNSQLEHGQLTRTLAG